MGVKVKDLDSPLKSFLVDGEIRGATDGEIEDAGGWHQGQEASLASGVDATTVQKFFDFVPRRVFLPWLRALTAKANGDGEKVKQLEKTTVPGVSDRVKTLEEETVPALDERMTGAEEDIEAEQERTDFLLGDARDMIISRRVYNEDESVFNNPENDPSAIGLSVLNNLIKRNALRGIAENDADTWYYLLDMETKGIYYLNYQILQEWLTHGNSPEPIISFAALNEYDAESSTAMSGIAVAEALAAFENETLPKKIKDYVDSEILGGEW